MSFTTKCPKCSVGIISFDYQGEQAYGLEQEPIAEALMYEDQSVDPPTGDPPMTTRPTDDPPKYLLFMGNCYYAQGGTGDFVGIFPSLARAEAAVPLMEYKRSQFGHPFDGDMWYEVAVLERDTLRTVRLARRSDSTTNPFVYLNSETDNA